MLIKLAGICASVPYASIYIKTLPGVITILAVAFLWAFSYLLLKRVHVKLMVSLSLLIVLVSLLAYSLFYYNAVEVSVIQEDASTSVVICHNRQTVVCTDAKESYLLRQLLKEKGVRQIDALVVLNARESAVKTLSALVNAYPVKAVWTQSSLLQDLKTACPGRYWPVQSPGDQRAFGWQGADGFVPR